jgi:AraC-like DNA-binding protein
MSGNANNLFSINADVHTLFESDFYRVLDFKCKCTDCSTSKPEYSDSFTISFVRKGNFLFNVFKHSFDSFTGCVLLSKPGYERTVKHTHIIPDECTIFDFKKHFYEELTEQYGYLKFLFDNDSHSTFIKINAETELLHHYIFHRISAKQRNKLETDQLVMNLIETVFGKITDYTPNQKITEKLKRNHLGTVERAKEYIIQNLTDDISLKEIADYCFVSSFHFSRLFKTITSYSPYQFLLQARLKNAELLLRDTSLKIADIAYRSGFNSIENFSAAFKNYFRRAPVHFKSVIKD